MDEIIQILIFVGAMIVAVIGQSAKNKKKPAAPSPDEVLEDVFPDIEAPMPLAEEVRPLRPVAPEKNFDRPRPVMQKPVKDTPPPARKQTDRIRLNTRSEARRAFIHSEIFNRKY